MDNNTHKEHTVIAMSDYKPETGYAALAQVEAYWEALRGNRIVPRRSDVDPRGIEQALEYAFIIERIAPGIARLRIAGSHLVDIMGVEVRGMPLTTFFAPDARARVSDVLEQVFQTPATAELRFAAAAAPERPALEGRMILLPLKSDLGDVSRILGCLICKGDIGLAPRRFALTEERVRPIRAASAAPAPEPFESTTSDRQPEPPLTGMSEAAKPFQRESAPKAAGRKQNPPYLRLVKSDES